MQPATYHPNHQQVTHAGLSRSVLCIPAAVMSSSPKVSCVSPRQQPKAKGIDLLIKEKKITQLVMEIKRLK